VRIIHRIAGNFSEADQQHLSAMGITVPQDVGSFEMDEADPRWPAVVAWARVRQPISSTSTRFSAKEVREAHYLTFDSRSTHGYPEPSDGDWERLVYAPDEGCEKCARGRVQQHPFRLAREPRWGRSDLLQLHWLADQFFVRPEVWARVFQPWGIDCRAVWQVRTGRPLETVVQLVIPPGDVPLALDASFSHEVCPRCGATKYHVPTRGYFPALTGTVSRPLFTSQEYFGSGGLAFKAVLMTQAFAAWLATQAVHGYRVHPLAAGEGALPAQQPRRGPPVPPPGAAGRLIPEPTGAVAATPAAPPARDVVALTAALRQPAVLLLPTDAASTSFLGGSPPAYDGASWPTVEGQPLAFLASLDLATRPREVALDWLPTAGHLLFFYDVQGQPWGFRPADRDRWRVIHVPADRLRPGTLPVPAGLPTESRLPRQALTLRLAALPPAWPSEALATLALSDAEEEALEVYRRYDIFDGAPCHHLGGAPEALQSTPMALECQLVSHGLDCGTPAGFTDPRAAALTPGATDWTLLLQLDSDDALGMRWGDEGRLFFWIRREDAHAGHFDRAWVILQCV
jgi:uncharacterized protein YwqG